MLSVLLAAGCGLNRADLVGASPLIASVSQGHVDTTRMIVAHAGVDLEWKDNERRTALIVAAQQGHQYIMHDLISAGTSTLNIYYLLTYLKDMSEQ